MSATLGPVHRYDELASTNDEARRLVGQGAPDGTVVLARRQTGGRGRLGRHWFSPEGNVFLSYVHQSRHRPEALAGLTLDAGTAIADVIADLGLEPALKWPNDVQLGGRKVAGVLTELVTDAPHGQAVAIVGVGVNVALRPADLPDALRPIATSLDVEAGQAFDPEDVALRVAARLRQKLAGFEATGAPDVAAYQRWFAQLGQRVRFVDPADGVVAGVVQGVAHDGGLLVLADGAAAPTTVRAGEITPEEPA